MIQAKALLFSKEAEGISVDIDAEDFERKTPLQMAQTKTIKDMLQRYRQTKTRNMPTENPKP